MRKALLVLVLLLAWDARAQNCNSTGCPLLVGIYAFASLPTAANCPSCMAVVNNASATNACDGAGALFALCRSNGTAWQAVAGGAGGGGGNSFTTIGVATADSGTDTLTVTDSASVDFTTTNDPEDITATVLPAGVTLTGDIDGAASTNDLDEVNVEVELETVLDLLDLQDAGTSTCTGGQQVRRNAGDTGFECFTATGGSLIVEEADGTPSISGVTRIQFDQADGFTVTDETGGQVQIDSTGGGGGLSYAQVAAAVLAGF